MSRIENGVVVVGLVSRSDLAVKRQLQVVESTWPGDGVAICVMVGMSCIATARCALGAAIASDPPASGDVVVLLDDDVLVSSVDLLAIVGQCRQSGEIVVGTYPIRDSCEGAERLSPDLRLAHRVNRLPDGDVQIHGGLGCVAFPMPVFRELHGYGEIVSSDGVRVGNLVCPWSEMSVVVPGGNVSTCPYRACVQEGQWFTEDLFFFRLVERAGFPTQFYPLVLRHAGQVADSRYRMLDGTPIVSPLVAEF